MAFTFTPQAIKEIVLIEPQIFGDERGFFLEVYKKSVFSQLNLEGEIVQINHSKSASNVLRGLHYQKNPYSQGKIVTVVSGQVFDVAVDIRQNSPTYGQSVSADLSANNKHMLYIPAGFAHGFCVTSDSAEMIYYCTAEYAPEHESGIKWNDPQLKIDWPIKKPVVSEKDQSWPALEDADNNFIYSPTIG